MRRHALRVHQVCRETRSKFARVVTVKAVTGDEVKYCFAFPASHGDILCVCRNFVAAPARAQGNITRAAHREHVPFAALGNTPVERRRRVPTAPRGSTVRRQQALAPTALPACMA